MVLVRKKSNKLRLTSDYRYLNSITVPDQFPLGRIEAMFTALAGATSFTCMDLQHGYFNVVIDPASVPLTAFRLPFGQFEYLRIAQGLRNAPSHFSRVMEAVFGDVNLDKLILYIDDLMLFSKTTDQHLQIIIEVLKRLIEHKLKVSGKKCQWLSQKATFLGHVISDAGIEADPEKTCKVRNWPKPQNVNQLRQFIGFVSYFRRFIKSFASMMRPLYSFLRPKRKAQFRYSGTLKRIRLSPKQGKLW